MYRTLNPVKIFETAESIEKRISERFPSSGLRKVSAEVSQICGLASKRVAEFDETSWALRFIIALLGALLVFLVVAPFYFVKINLDVITLTELIQTLEAGINDLVLVSVAIFFLFTAEVRIKRKKALEALHELRCVAHVIDMHQLTKDPAILSMPSNQTAASPTRDLTPFELERYLDYCTELLSVLGKIAALYAQHLNDMTALQAVDSVEDLTTSLSRKIWQKILVLQDIQNH